MQPQNLHTIPAFQEVKINDELKLRPLIQTDAKRILEILDAEPNIREKVKVASLFHKPEDVAKEIEFYHSDTGLIRYVLLKNEKPVGMVSFWRDSGFFGTEPNPNEYGFGYFLDPKERGQGLITRAITTLMQLTKENLKVDNFAAYCEDHNEESIAVIKKLGFTPTDDTYPEPTKGWIERKYIKTIK